ncbi:MAG: HAD family hydrolase [Nitrospiria bacterium]
MLKAIIFDCDGVIVDSEPHHLKAFQIVLDAEGIPLTKQDYYEKYLALDDKGLFERILTEHQRPVDNKILKRLILRKMPLYKKLSSETLYLYPGVVDFINKAVGKYRLAIASGAFRGEIKAALDKGGIRSAFPIIVSAQDVRNGKPHPEAFLTALEKLNTISTATGRMSPNECLVIEDSIHGVEAARAAGMKCLAVTNSYPLEMLQGKADRIVDSLSKIQPSDLESLFDKKSAEDT